MLKSLKAYSYHAINVEDEWLLAKIRPDRFAQLLHPDGREKRTFISQLGEGVVQPETVLCEKSCACAKVDAASDYIIGCELLGVSFSQRIAVESISVISVVSP